jgi:hypothetical protein
MRTTLELPDPLFREIKTRAVQKGVKLKELLAQYIQAGMTASEGDGAVVPKTRVPLPYFRSPDESITPARSNAELYAILEEEEVAYHTNGSALEKTRR